MCSREFSTFLEGKMNFKFTKMHGCGNDYIYFDCRKERLENPAKVAKKLSNRHFSVGGDGIVMICPSTVADAKMRMFNSDGSEGKMCGNAIRCVGKYLSDNKIVDRDTITIETMSGIKILKLKKAAGRVVSARVDMGKPEFRSDKIPVNVAENLNKLVSYPIKIDNVEYNITCVSMGNPHCVVFCDSVDEIDMAKLGPKFENNRLFPEKINTEFVQILSPNEIKMRVWERGSGETMACGTGACAAVVAAVENGFCRLNECVRVRLLGGQLEICYTKDAVYMEGDAHVAFKGEVEI